MASQNELVLRGAVNRDNQACAWAGRVTAGFESVDADGLVELLAMLGVDPSEAKAWGRRGRPLSGELHMRSRSKPKRARRSADG